MKSLLQTLPSAQTVEVWGALVRTNLKMVVDYSNSVQKQGDKLLIPLILDVFTDVEKFDLLVKKGSVTLRGRKLSIWMAPGPSFRARLKVSTGSSRASGTFQLSRCHFCKELVTGSGQQVHLHDPDCPMVAVIEVMES